MQKRKAIVIGAGIAGIAAAIRLSVRGFSVDVYEKNEMPGGKITSFIKEGFHFDAVPARFIQPENMEELFQMSGEPMAEYFSYKPIPVACKYFYESGREVIAYTDRDLFAAEMQEQTGEPAKNIINYLDASEKLYKRIGNIFLNYSLHKRKTWLHHRVLKVLPSIKFPYLFKTMNGIHNGQFKTPEARQLFNRFTVYNGSSPYKAPALLSMIPHPEHHSGVFYPDGGMSGISNALYALALKKNVVFHFNAPVKKIICPENKAAGIVVNEKNIFSDIVVSNGDAYFTHQNMVGRSPKSKKIFRRERSSSVFVFYWGINKDFPGLDLHNVFFSADPAAESDHIFRQKKLYSDPTVSVHISSKAEAGKAPQGCENWLVMINMPANTEYDPDALATEAKKYITGKLNRMLQTEIEPLIIAEEILHPQKIEKTTGSYRGSICGAAAHSKKSAFLRHPNFTSYIKNLYFCGSSVHPGGGVPLCLKSAMIVDDLVKNDFRDQTAAHA